MIQSLWKKSPNVYEFSWKQKCEEKGKRLKWTHLLLNRFVQIEQSKRCSFCGVTELFLAKRFAVDVDGVDFFTIGRFKWMRCICSFRFDFRVNFILQWSHSKIRSFVCTRKWQRSEFLPNIRLHIGHGIFSLLQISHLCSISWKMHSASVCVLRDNNEK